MLLYTSTNIVVFTVVTLSYFADCVLLQSHNSTTELIGFFISNWIFKKSTDSNNRKNITSDNWPGQLSFDFYQSNILARHLNFYGSTFYNTDVHCTGVLDNNYIILIHIYYTVYKLLVNTLYTVHHIVVYTQYFLYFCIHRL